MADRLYTQGRVKNSVNPNAMVEKLGNQNTDWSHNKQETRDLVMQLRKYCKYDFIFNSNAALQLDF